jgi:hypothetical protein
VLTYETLGAAVEDTRTSGLDPEPPHSVENVDVHRYHSFRVELRHAQPDAGESLDRNRQL